MTRYANLKRNADIVAAFLMHVAPKQIVVVLRPRYPEITLKIVYKVVEMFQVERIGEIRGNAKIDSEESTA